MMKTCESWLDHQEERYQLPWFQLCRDSKATRKLPTQTQILHFHSHNRSNNREEDLRTKGIIFIPWQAHSYFLPPSPKTSCSVCTIVLDYQRSLPSVLKIQRQMETLKSVHNVEFLGWFLQSFKRDNNKQNHSYNASPVCSRFNTRSKP